MVKESLRELENDHSQAVVVMSILVGSLVMVRVDGRLLAAASPNMSVGHGMLDTAKTRMATQQVSERPRAYGGIGNMENASAINHTKGRLPRDTEGHTQMTRSRTSTAEGATR